MQISIKAHVEEATRFLDDVHRKQIPFASIYAATLTAKAVKVEEMATMRRVFDRPTPYTLNSLSATPATKQRPIATVETDLRNPGKGTPAKRFLNPQIHGGTRSQKSHERQLATLMGTTYMVPASSAPKDAYGNVTGATFMRIVSQLRAAGDSNQNASNSRRSKRKRKNDAFFKLKGKPVIMHRKGVHLQPVLVGVRAPHYQKRFPFFEVADATVQREFPQQFVLALERAIARSHFKNARGTTWKSMGYGVNG